MKLNIFLVIIILWFQFGADLYREYQFNQCTPRPGFYLQGMSFQALYIMPGGFQLLEILIGTCDYRKGEK